VDPVIFFSFSTMVCEFLVQGQTNTWNMNRRLVNIVIYKLLWTNNKITE
jgi:hypothetical protein